MTEEVIRKQTDVIIDSYRKSMGMYDYIPDMSAYIQARKEAIDEIRSGISVSEKSEAFCVGSHPESVPSPVQNTPPVVYQPSKTDGYGISCYADSRQNTDPTTTAAIPQEGRYNTNGAGLSYETHGASSFYNENGAMPVYQQNGVTEYHHETERAQAEAPQKKSRYELLSGWPGPWESYE